jgi:ribosomal protein L29
VCDMSSKELETIIEDLRKELMLVKTELAVMKASHTLLKDANDGY